ncbi:TPA: type IV secretion system protein [Acinetobacter baumannii]|uniref:type IV secretion system protein n=1 Tax=Acinetobacter TaxID=469 RepID=UPI000E2CC5D2|nr:type IV secretion system protein [Acinetobacter pittii]AZC05411.1 hypothetical protein DKE50_021560 [Acinetobacter nosocomialis]QXA10027.1 type IV secretion system protein [Acinetobacter pittii]
MKKLLLATMFGATMVMTANVNAGIPVVDAVGNGQRMANFIKEMAEMTNQLNTMKSQLTQQQATYKSLVGSRDLNQLLNAGSKYLPAETLSAYEKIRSGDTSSLLGAMTSLSQKYKNTGNSSTTSKQAVQNASREAQLRNEAIIDQAFQRSNSRINNIQRLMNQIDATGDTKASADLQNRINAEMGLIQLEQQNIQLVKYSVEAQDKLRAQQMREVSQKRNSSTNAMPTFKQVY